MATQTPPQSVSASSPAPSEERLDLRVCVPLLGMHLGCLSVLLTGASPLAIGVCLGLLWLRAFGLTAGYHRLLSHRSFRTSRAGQLVFAVLGCSAAQLGPLWWVGHHREHHRYSDTERDVHSPRRGLWWAHMGWLLCRKNQAVRERRVGDLSALPELRLLERWHWLVPLSLAAALYGLGALLEHRAPGLGTSGPQLLGWGFFVSTVALYHLTFAVNSLGHARGWQRYPGRDQSRNGFWLGLLSLGDGWHNNHHRHPLSARHGIGAREPDLTWLGLRALERVGWVWDLRPEPSSDLRTGSGSPPTRSR